MRAQCRDGFRKNSDKVSTGDQRHRQLNGYRLHQRLRRCKPVRLKYRWERTGSQGDIIEVTGRILNRDGEPVVKTVKPGAYPAGPDWKRPPHVHFEVHGQFELLITQMYFPNEPLNATDRLLNAALRPDLLIATVSPQDHGPYSVFKFDIVLSRG